MNNDTIARCILSAFFLFVWGLCVIALSELFASNVATWVKWFVTAFVVFTLSSHYSSLQGRLR